MSIHPDIPNFSWSELKPGHCSEEKLIAHCCLKVSDRFWLHMKNLQSLREDWGGPLRITSTWRDEAYNRSVRGAPNSQHLIWATDVTPIDPDPTEVEELAILADQAGFNGIGIYPQKGFVHLDMRGEQARWIK